MSYNWKIFEGDDSDWDELLKQLGQKCVFQSSRWARHKSSTGWSSARIVKNTGDSQIAIQCLVRKGPFGIAMAWAPGGFAGDLSLMEHTGLFSVQLQPPMPDGPEPPAAPAAPDPS